MSSSISQSSERFVKTISFKEWFEHEPREGEKKDPATDIDAVYSERANQERFEANHPLSKIYTVRPGDQTSQKATKCAIRFFCFLLVIPIIIVKAIDFFKGQRRTIKSDVESKFTEIKQRIDSDRNRIRMTVLWDKRSNLERKLKQLESKQTQTDEQQRRINYIRASLNLEMPLFKTYRDIDRLDYRVLKMFSGDEKKAAWFLNTLNQTPSYELRAQLRSGIGEILEAKYRPDDPGKVDFGQQSKFLNPNEPEKKDHIHLDFSQKKITCVFGMDAQWMSNYKIELLAKGTATTVFDFTKETVDIVWEKVKGS